MKKDDKKVPKPQPAYGAPKPQPKIAMKKNFANRKKG